MFARDAAQLARSLAKIGEKTTSHATLVAWKIYDNFQFSDRRIEQGGDERFVKQILIGIYGV